MAEEAKEELRRKLAEIQQELKAKKSQYNKFGRYNYRKCEDILEAVKPLLGDYLLLLSDDVVQVGDRHYIKATARLESVHGFQISVSAYAREEETKKGMDAAQITGAASSYARKYALCGLLLVDDGNDADSMDNTTAAAAAQSMVPPVAAQPATQYPPEVCPIDGHGTLGKRWDSMTPEMWQMALDTRELQCYLTDGHKAELKRLIAQHNNTTPTPTEDK
jgi:hypothetical protein